MAATMDSSFQKYSDVLSDTNSFGPITVTDSSFVTILVQ